MSRVLNRTLRANGLFSVLCGLVAVAFASSFADYLDVAPPAIYVIGGGVLVFGVSILTSLRVSPSSTGFARWVVIADTAWVVGAGVVLVVPGSMDNKWVLAVVSTVVAVFAALQARELAGAVPRRLATEIEIASDPEAVWLVLTDLESFSQWNPFMPDASGDLVAGSQLRVRMSPPGGSAFTFTPRVTSITPGEHFEWLGHLLVPGLFDGRHRFELEPTAEGTRLLHTEAFNGLLVPLLWYSLDTKSRAGFEAMNRALRERVEGLVRDSA